MFSYQTGALSGSEAYAATSVRGRAISIWVRTSTGTSPGYRLASGQVVEDLGLAGDRRRAPGEHDRLGLALVSHLDLGARPDAGEAARRELDQLGRLAERERDRPLQTREHLLLGALAVPPSPHAGRIAPDRRACVLEPERLRQAGDLARSILRPVRALGEGQLAGLRDRVRHGADRIGPHASSRARARSAASAT